MIPIFSIGFVGLMILFIMKWRELRGGRTILTSIRNAFDPIVLDMEAYIHKIVALLHIEQLWIIARHLMIIFFRTWARIRYEMRLWYKSIRRVVRMRTVGKKAGPVSFFIRDLLSAKEERRNNKEDTL